MPNDRTLPSCDTDPDSLGEVVSRHCLQEIVDRNDGFGLGSAVRVEGDFLFMRHDRKELPDAFSYLDPEREARVLFHRDVDMDSPDAALALKHEIMHILCSKLWPDAFFTAGEAEAEAAALYMEAMVARGVLYTEDVGSLDFKREQDFREDVRAIFRRACVLGAGISTAGVVFGILQGVYSADQA